MEQLKTGNLKSITDYVRVDPYLDLELRGDSVMIYYRGGKVLTVDEREFLQVWLMNTICRLIRRESYLLLKVCMTTWLMQNIL